MATNNKIEILEVRIKHSPGIFLLIVVLLEVMLFTAYINGYIDGFLAVWLHICIFGASLAIFGINLSRLQRDLADEKKKAEIEAGERLTNGEPIAVFHGITKYRIKSDADDYYDWEELTEERERVLLGTGLLRIAVRRAI